MANSKSFRETYIEHLQENPEEAIIYLDTAMEEYQKDAHAEAFLLALKTVAEAFGGVGKLSKKTNIHRQSLHKALSAKGNPSLKTITPILNSMGYRLAIQPITP